MTPEEKRIFYYSEIYEMLKIAAANPGSYPQILIAECKGSQDLLGVLAMMQLATPPEEKALNPRMGNSMISALLEYSPDIRKNGILRT